MEFEFLFSPIKIGSMEVKSRIIMPAMGTNYADRSGFVTDQMVKYYERRAQGGAGLIITELASVDPLGKFTPLELSADGDQYVKGLSILAESVKKHGSRVALQLHHSGRQTKAAIIGAQPVSASSIRCPWSREVPRELTIVEVEELVGKYAASALRAKKAGFDAVELHAAHGYFINQFLSPYSNKRTDKYGGSVRKRARFAVEIIKAIKEVVGTVFPVLIKISANEYVEGGLTIDESKEIASLLETAGIDAITVSAGVFETSEWMVPPMRLPRGCHVHLAAAIKEVVSVPVVAIGGINDPTMAEAVLREKKADLVAMGRALIADPDLPEKARRGDLLGIRKCIACNNCADHIFKETGITCTVNPEVSREIYPELKKTNYPKKVLVAGAGPGGLEAARVLKIRGHKVTIYEQADRIGGQVNLGIIGPHKEQVALLLDYYSEQIKRLNIDINLGHTLTREMIEREKPDAVVVSTGSIPSTPAILRGDGKKLALAVDVLAGKAKVGHRVIIAGGGTVGCETAEYLAARGHAVWIIEMRKAVGLDIESVTRRLVHRDLISLGVKTLTNAKITDIIGGKMIYIDGEGIEKSIVADSIVIAMGATPNDELLRELGKKTNVFAVGDCLKARKIVDAIFEGWKIGREI